jgi:CubicO group peptidase (beta-lactamase class C family)
LRNAAVLLLALAGVGAAPLKEGPLKGLDEYVQQAMKEWEVPGLALAVVKDDAVVLARGYGVRKLGEAAAVDERTLFAIASCSKAFTAAALAMLVEEGKLGWDDPVTKHLPKFQMPAPYVTREMTVRDLLCHRSGLPRHDLLWLANPTLGRDEILGRLRHARPNSSFRSKFGYQNILFLAAGQVVPAVTGKSWDDFVKERVFTPLGMSASNTSVKALRGAGNVACPHEKVEGKLQPVPYRDIDNVAPAGSINSNAADMARWVRLQLGKGTFQERRLLRAASVKEMHTPEVFIRETDPLARFFPEARFLSYGLGWFVVDYRGRTLVTHGGSLDGMNCSVTLVPQEKLGVVVLTNRRPNQLMIALTRRVIDAYRGEPARDWSAELLKSARKLEEGQKAAQARREKERVRGTRPSLPLEDYAGTYRDELYGEVRVSREKEALLLRLGTGLAGELEHWHYDTFRVAWKDRLLGKALVTFVLDARGKVAEVKVAQAGEDVVARRARP